MKSNLLVLLMSGICCSLALPSLPARGDTIGINLTGFNFNYAGSQISDAGGPAFATDPSTLGNAAGLAAIQLFDNGALIPGGTLTNNVYADLQINGIAGIPAAGGVATWSPGNSCTLDLLRYNPGTNTVTTLLGLTLHPTDIYYSNTGDFVVSGGVVASMPVQNLGDYGLTLTAGTSVSIASSAMTHVVASGGSLTSFNAFGTGDFNGTGSYTRTPEPSTLAGLLTMAAFAVAVHARRRRKPRQE